MVTDVRVAFSGGPCHLAIVLAVHSIEGVYYANFSAAGILFHLFHAIAARTASAGVVA